MNYLLFNDQEVLGRICCQESDIEQNCDGHNYVVDEFEAYHPSKLTVVNDSIALKTDLQLSSDEQAKNLFDIRSTRNLLLTQSDWTQVTDNPLTDAQRQDWAAYRQELRDITDSYTDPLNIVWPTKPNL